MKTILVYQLKLVYNEIIPVYTIKTLLGSGFQPFSSHGTHKLVTKISWHTRKYKYNCDSFTPDSYCWVGIFFYLTVCEKGGECP